MAFSPSQTWKDGKLVTRAQDSRGATEENEAVAVTGDPTKQAEPNSTFTSRRKAREAAAKPATKAVDTAEAEDKAVKRTSSKRK